MSVSTVMQRYPHGLLRKHSIFLHMLLLHMCIYLAMSINIIIFISHEAEGGVGGEGGAGGPGQWLASALNIFVASAIYSNCNSNFVQLLGPAAFQFSCTQIFRLFPMLRFNCKHISNGRVIEARACAADEQIHKSQIHGKRIQLLSVHITSI